MVVIPQATLLLLALSRHPTAREAVAVTLGFRLLDFRGTEYASLIDCRLKERASLSTQRSLTSLQGFKEKLSQVVIPGTAILCSSV